MSRDIRLFVFENVRLCISGQNFPPCQNIRQLKTLRENMISQIPMNDGLATFVFLKVAATTNS